MPNFSGTYTLRDVLLRNATELFPDPAPAASVCQRVVGILVAVDAVCNPDICYNVDCEYQLQLNARCEHLTVIDRRSA